MLTSSTMPERHHRDRQPRDQPGRREGEGAGVGEHPAVGGEHRTTLRRRQWFPSPWQPPPRWSMPDPSRTTPCCSSPSAVREARRRGPVPAQRHRRQGHPRRRGSRRSASTTSSFGGRSPINDQNRDLIAAIEADLEANGVDLPVYWGNRNWDPYLRDALEQMKADGVTRAAALLTSAYSSYSGCRQYRENLAAAVAAVPGAPRIDRLRALLQPPGLHRADGRRHPRRARRPARGRPPRRAPRLRHALDPGRA